MEQTLERRIAAELRAELARQDQTGRWLADVTGLSVSSVARWIKGTRAPGVNELDAMCLALGMSVADLLQRVEVTGGYERPSIPLQRGPLSLVPAENTATSDQKVRGSNPFGCTKAEIVPLPSRGRRRRDYVTPPPVYALAAAS